MPDGAEQRAGHGAAAPAMWCMARDGGDGGEPVQQWPGDHPVVDVGGTGRAGDHHEDPQPGHRDVADTERAKTGQGTGERGPVAHERDVAAGFVHELPRHAECLRITRPEDEIARSPVAACAGQAVGQECLEQSLAPAGEGRPDPFAAVGVDRIGPAQILLQVPPQLAGHVVAERPGHTVEVHDDPLRQRTSRVDVRG
ncbi:hypothetical protein KZ829_06875 [Actinoplanes hulinensis]|uniref:Uncharacterized protein n=1 Tax=Actinoplanes hulinensis TaxID=1144547 RepID=A0ABS7AXH4_9ACTN|nr:hypothetical protein [Actinoplanes hulinensis]MBW6433465.1 hypothetical protein [Actinoplanes hulinensis]